MGKRVLFLSNGHGEDLNSSLIVAALQRQQPDLAVSALPIVGEGKAYRRLGVPIICPTQQLPSSGFNYINFARLLNPRNWARDLNPLNLWRDLRSGLVGLTVQQFQALRHHSPTCDLLWATGDVVPVTFAYLSGRPFVAFLVSGSSYYEGRLKLPLVARLALASPRCRAIFTRDEFTATDLQRRGLTKARFDGYPIMDVLTPRGADLAPTGDPLVALLPGSRLPEALHNLALQLQLCEQANPLRSLQFVAALVPAITPDHLAAIAAAQGWQLAGNRLCKGSTVVTVHHDAFADILHHCTAALGMAGTAVEQAVGLGKPVVQIIGSGPQFTYPFAEAQMRLLGESVITVGQRSATPALINEAARTLVQIVDDRAFLQRCAANGKVRVGAAGGSAALARHLIAELG